LSLDIRIQNLLEDSMYEFSVADPGCLSRILIFTHPGSRIPDPKTAAKEGGEKNFVVITFYVATNFTKLQIILVLMDLGSGIRKKPIPDPGSRIQGSKRHRIPDPDPHYCV
jgi:hypothetical protein